MRSKSLKVLITAAGISAAMALTGCVTLLPKTNPVQLYRFGYDVQKLGKETLPEREAATPVPLAFGTVDFPQDSAGDRVMTVEGNQISYVADARWASPAQAMFNQAISEGFARSGQDVSLQARGPSVAKYRLDIAVRRFETDYSRNKPMVSIALDARIIRLSDRAVIGQRFINTDVPVRKNDMSLIVEGYNAATSQAVAALILLSEETITDQPVKTPAEPQAVSPAPKKAPAKQKVEGL